MQLIGIYKNFIRNKKLFILINKFKYLQEYLGSKYNQSKIEESTCNMPLFEYKFKCPVCRGECLTSKTMKVYKG